MAKGIVIDASKCICCRSCEAACSLVKEGEVNPALSRIRLQIFPETYFYYPNVCAQCQIPYCALTCPTRALEKNYETGRVDFFETKCIGCKMCVAACPFGCITVRNGKSVKCDLCDGDPTCVKFCETKAIRYAEIDDLADTKALTHAQRFLEAHEIGMRDGV